MERTPFATSCRNPWKLVAVETPIKMRDANTPSRVFALCRTRRFVAIREVDGPTISASQETFRCDLLKLSALKFQRLETL